MASNINGVTNMLPTSPLTSQYDDIPPNILCDTKGYPYSTWNQHRECVNILTVPKDILLEIVLCDTGKCGKTENMSSECVNTFSVVLTHTHMFLS